MFSTTLLLLLVFAIVASRSYVALSVTVAEVKEGAGSVTGTGVAGVTITAGQPVYEDANDGKIKLADADLSIGAAKARGFALHAALANQPIRYQKGGKFIIGTTAAPAKGTVYVVGATAGAVHPHGDLASTWYTTILGVGDGLGGIDMPPGGPFASGNQVP